jgi:hypothetical protein
MTPSMGMAAPKGTQAPAAGLAAIAQPATAPRGKSPENMGEIMSLARRMSDAQLADVLSGKSLDVPQFAAMTEAMGRKSLRQAVQGQQAMAQAKKPSLKDQLMGEYQQEQMAQMAARAPQGGGIPNIPAPNMESMDMASGGIVAFDSGGEVPRFNEGGNWFTELRDSLYTPEEKRIEAMKRGRATDQPTDTLSENQVNALLRGKTPGPAEAPMPPASMQQEIDDSKMRLFKQEMADKEAAANAKPIIAGPTQEQRNAFYEKSKAGTGVGNASGNQPFSIPSFEQLQGKKSTDYLSKLEGLSDKQRAGIAQLKKEGGGEALLQLAAAVFGSPNLAQAAAKGLPMVASTAASTRKEARAVENLANEYDLNLAKSREAAEKGDMALALQYQQLANQAKAQGDTAAYQQGMLGIHQGRNAIMGEAGQLGKVQLGLANADKQALNEAKIKFPFVNKSNQAAFDAFVQKRSQQLKMENPLTKQYANLGSGDFGSPRFNTVQSLPKGAKIYDPSADDQS